MSNAIPNYFEKGSELHSRNVQRNSNTGATDILFLVMQPERGPLHAIVEIVNRRWVQKVETSMPINQWPWWQSGFNTFSVVQAAPV